MVVAGGLDWAAYSGPADLVPGVLGTREPAAARLGAGALAAAAAVLVPALAVDRRGIRLGRGGGYYDRALRLVAARTPVVALLHDGELVRPAARATGGTGRSPRRSRRPAGGRNCPSWSTMAVSSPRS